MSKYIDDQTRHYQCRVIEGDELEVYFSDDGAEFLFVREGTDSVWLNNDEAWALYIDLQQHLRRVGVLG